MKKLLPLLVITLLFAAGCASSALKKESEYIAFEYEAMTRGAYKKVIVKQDTVITLNSRDTAPITTGLKKGDWNKLLSALQKVDLDKISELKPPSTRSHVDAALAANLKVIRKDKTYQSNGFDHGNPPAEIKVLVEEILAVSALENK
ncbi:hypothetical protein DVK85_05000 [Flavobacterium arcticum]|uniref:Lipoprotein n=1 Tax=Flavobacterium arcticum TaxID=1784713 RepID=A0A345HAL1_9FLAO|nr:hypothetical protein [Flavobacterium arcticum]AXG73621.1 hypothetical protein DVK85_05000 [Flavobacterium arcticum]KAF2511571.1 hypothetical protein E0W72_04510 [Flavobacterium arcticum]